MKVALVYLNNERNVGRGAAYIAGAILRAGHSLAFFDTYYYSLESVARRIAAGEFHCLMVSSMTMLFPDAVRLIRLVKKRSDIPVLVGGIHATILGGQLLDEVPEIDYLCVGEGESAVVEFLDRLGSDSLHEVANLAYRRDGRVAVNPVRPAEDLSRLPRFPWHLFSRDAIVQADSGFVFVTATRGCPYNCTYCANGVYLRYYGKGYLRFQPGEPVIEEMLRLRRAYHPKLFYFGDEMILSDAERAIELFRAVRDRVGVPYGCMARVEHINRDIVRRMADSGCRYVAMGVECGDEEFRRKHLRRTMSNEQLQQAFALVREAGIFVTSFNMIGFPFPNDDGLTEATIRLNEKLKPDYAQVSIFYPFPGTDLHQHCVERDLIDPRKLAATTDYHKDSVLRGVSVHDRVKRIRAHLNPHGFRFEIGTPASAPPPPGGGPAASKPARQSVLMLAPGGPEQQAEALAGARALVESGREVDLVTGFDAAEETHCIREGVDVHCYDCAAKGWVPRHPVVIHLLSYIPPSHIRLRNFFARILGAAERLFFQRRAGQALIVSRLQPLAADVVHVRGCEALRVGATLAGQWGARLVYEPLSGSGGTKGLNYEIDLVLQSRQRSAEQLPTAYADLDSGADKP
ncbi:MAG: radical SAM protein [Anaerolineaceae bacterium]|nr:radical SAM protein [Anaerolineaceae bacterium]